MKKLFSLVVLALMTFSVASAEVLWSETLDKNGTYIDRSGADESLPWGTFWPYANQWWTVGNFVNEYTNVASYSCSIRNKRINGDSDNTIGFYFGASKAAAECYLTLEGDIYTAAEGNVLAFEITSPESGSAAEEVAVKAQILVNDAALTLPEINVPAAANSTTVQIALPAGAITKLHITFDQLSSQKFITNLRIEDQATALNDATVAAKAVKTINANGELVIIKNGVTYNALGAVIE